MKRKNIIIAATLTTLTVISSVRAEEVKIIEVTEQVISASAAKEVSMADVGKADPMHDDSHMKDEKGHRHDEEGMHGMMMGHDMGGWGIVIVILMIAMMTGHILVIAR